MAMPSVSYVKSKVPPKLYIYVVGGGGRGGVEGQLKMAKQII